MENDSYLLESQFEVFNVLLQAGSFLFELLLVLEELVAGIFLLLQTLLGVLFSFNIFNFSSLAFWAFVSGFFCPRKKREEEKGAGMETFESKTHQTIPEVGTLDQTWFSFSLKPATHNTNTHKSGQRHNRQMGGMNRTPTHQIDYNQLLLLDRLLRLSQTIYSS